MRKKLETLEFYDFLFYLPCDRLILIFFIYLLGLLNILFWLLTWKECFPNVIAKRKYVYFTDILFYLRKTCFVEKNVGSILFLLFYLWQSEVPRSKNLISPLTSLSVWRKRGKNMEKQTSLKINKRGYVQRQKDEQNILIANRLPAINRKNLPWRLRCYHKTKKKKIRINFSTLSLILTQHIIITLYKKIRSAFTFQQTESIWRENRTHPRQTKQTPVVYRYAKSCSAIQTTIFPRIFFCSPIFYSNFWNWSLFEIVCLFIVSGGNVRPTGRRRKQMSHASPVCSQVLKLKWGNFCPWNLIARFKWKNFKANEKHDKFIFNRIDGWLILKMSESKKTCIYVSLSLQLI